MQSNGQLWMEKSCIWCGGGFFRREAAPCWASNWYESDRYMYEFIGENVSQQFNKRLQLISEGLKCRATRRTAIQFLRNIHGKKQWNTHNFQSAVYRTQQHKKKEHGRLSAFAIRKGRQKKNSEKNERCVSLVHPIWGDHWDGGFHPWRFAFSTAPRCVTCCLRESNPVIDTSSRNFFQKWKV